jgi:hypothetical protein
MYLIQIQEQTLTIMEEANEFVESFSTTRMITYQ